MGITSAIDFCVCVCVCVCITDVGISDHKYVLLFTVKVTFTSALYQFSENDGVGYVVVSKSGVAKSSFEVVVMSYNGKQHTLQRVWIHFQLVWTFGVHLHLFQGQLLILEGSLN